MPAYNGSADLGNNGATATTFTTAYSVTVGSTMLFIGIVISGTTDRLTGGTVTYAGAAMTQIGVVANAVRTGYLYYMYRPASGSNNFVITATAGANIYIGAGAADYRDAGLLDQFSATTDSVGEATYTSTINVVASNAWSFLYAIGDAAGTITTGGTQRAIDGTNDRWQLGDSNGVVPTGSYTWATNDPAESSGNNTQIHCKASFAVGYIPYNPWELRAPLLAQ